MRKSVALHLSFSILSGVFHLDEMVMIPSLTNHYSEFQESQPAGSVFDFLYQHYVKNTHNDLKNNNRNHSRLPIKTGKVITSHIGMFIVDQNTAFVPYNSAIELNIPETENKLFTGFSIIWQPPKIS